MPNPTNPQPYRKDNKIRNSWESELWDQFLSSVLVTSTTSLSVPCTAASRLIIWAQADLSVADTLTLNVDGTALVPAATIGGAWTGYVLGTADVKIGSHTITLTAPVAVLSNTLIVCRRGRKPPV